MNIKSKFQDDTYFRLMRVLQESPRITQRDLAQKLGISLGSINYCLRALIEKGYVKVQNFSNNENKSKYVYLLTPSGIKEKTQLTLSFLQRKTLEYDSLKFEIESLQSRLVANQGERK